MFENYIHKCLCMQYMWVSWEIGYGCKLGKNDLNPNKMLFMLIALHPDISVLPYGHLLCGLAVLRSCSLAVSSYVFSCQEETSNIQPNHLLEIIVNEVTAIFPLSSTMVSL